jgi:hypothetical protein
MAIATINLFLQSKNFGTKISEKARGQLSKHGVEQYIFDKALIIEWCNWIQIEAGNVSGTIISGKQRKMTAALFKTLKVGFKKESVSGQGNHITMENNAFVVTQLSPRMASMFKKSSAASKHIRNAKRAAVDAMESDLTPEEKRKLQGAMFGHHGDVNVPGEGKPTSYTTPGGRTLSKTDFLPSPRTTGGLLKFQEDLGEHRATEGLKSKPDLQGILDGLDHRTTQESLYHVIVSRLSDHIDILLGFDRAPVKMLDSSQKKNMGAVEVSNVIQIKFALGTGKGGGTAYTQAMRDWDAGRGSRLANSINKVLENIEIGIIQDIISMAPKFAPDLIALRGSASVLDNMRTNVPRMIIDGMFPHKTRADMRFKVNKKLAIMGKKMSKGKVKPKSVAAKKAAMVKMLMAKKLPSNKKKKKGKRTVETAKTQTSPLLLRNLLNEMLPQMVASKMTSPALQFRTGRFANSARVEMIHQGPRGGMQVDYTYRKEPYQTFEPGYRQGSTMRDPRKIIKESIRELAIGILGRQPTTIRRT